MSFPPATSAMLHNLSTLGISLRSMTDLLEQKSSLQKWYAGASADAPAYRNDRSPSQKEAAAQILRSSLLF